MDNQRILMVSDLEYRDIEHGLRLLVNAKHSAACDARLRKESQAVIERYDAAYECAVMTYRRVIGTDPIAA